MSEVTIRRLTGLEEKAELIALCDGAFEHPVSERAVYPVLLDKIHRFGIFFAAHTHQPAGYAAMYANDRQTHTAFMTLLAVRPECQGMGVGKALMERCLLAAREAGMCRVRLEVHRENHRAISMYERFGFRFEAQHTEETIFMSKSLV